MTKQIALPYYSAEMQDLSALSLVGDSKSSDPNMFLDIGCGRPKYCNNTMLLEENGWEGICVDIEDFSEEFKEKKCIIKNMISGEQLTFLLKDLYLKLKEKLKV